MRYLLLFFVASVFTLGCQIESKELSSVRSVNWEKRKMKSPIGSVDLGTTYLSVYSNIYSRTEHQSKELTATISMRNINSSDSIYIHKAEYFNTKGEHIRTYFDFPIFIAPLETVEIVIDEMDREGGSGANFLFDWSVPEGTHEPYFEAVMISSNGQQGLSFTTRGVKVK